MGNDQNTSICSKQFIHHSMVDLFYYLTFMPKLIPAPLIILKGKRPIQLKWEKLLLYKLQSDGWLLKTLSRYLDLKTYLVDKYSTLASQLTRRPQSSQEAGSRRNKLGMLSDSSVSAGVVVAPRLTSLSAACYVYLARSDSVYLYREHP